MRSGSSNKVPRSHSLRNSSTLKGGWRGSNGIVKHRSQSLFVSIFVEVTQRRIQKLVVKSSEVPAAHANLYGKILPLRQSRAHGRASTQGWDPKIKRLPQTPSLSRYRYSHSLFILEHEKY